jgi:hypothetical protein
MAPGLQSCAHSEQPVQVSASIATLWRSLNTASVWWIDGQPSRMHSRQALQMSSSTWYRSSPPILRGKSMQGRSVMTTAGPSNASAALRADRQAS